MKPLPPPPPPVHVQAVGSGIWGVVAALLLIAPAILVLTGVLR